MDNDDSQHDLKGIIIALLLGKMTKSTVEHCRTGIIYWIALKQLHATACRVFGTIRTIAIRRTMSLVISVDLCSAARCSVMKPAMVKSRSTRNRANLQSDNGNDSETHPLCFRVALKQVPV